MHRITNTIEFAGYGSCHGLCTPPAVQWLRRRGPRSVPPVLLDYCIYNSMHSKR